MSNVRPYATLRLELRSMWQRQCTLSSSVHSL